MGKMLFEVLDELVAAGGNRTKVAEIIRANKSKPLAVLLMANYGHPLARLNEEELPKYKEDDSPAGMNYTTLAKETRRLDYFFEGGRGKTKQAILRLYQNLCEGMHPKEAKYFTKVITKSLAIDGLDYETINQGFGETFLQKPEVQDANRNAANV